MGSLFLSLFRPNELAASFFYLGLMTSQQLELSRTFFVLLLQTSPQKRGERRTNCRLYFGGEPCLFPVINAIYINHPGRERAGGNCGSYSDRRLIWETERRGGGGGLGPSALFIYFSFFPSSTPRPLFPLQWRKRRRRPLGNWA